MSQHLEAHPQRNLIFFGRSLKPLRVKGRTGGLLSGDFTLGSQPAWLVWHLRSPFAPGGAPSTFLGNQVPSRRSTIQSHIYSITFPVYFSKVLICFMMK